KLVTDTYAALHDKAVSSGAAADVLNRLERVWDSQVNGVNYGGFTQTLDGADGPVTKVTPALHHTDPVNGQDIAQPLYPEQFAGRVQLSSAVSVYDATSICWSYELLSSGGSDWHINTKKRW